MDKRQEIATLLRAGHAKNDIAQMLNVGRATVFRVAARLNAGEGLGQRPGSGRPKVLDPHEVKEAFTTNPTLKMTTFARTKGVSTMSVSNYVKNLGGKSLRKVEKPLLSEQSRNKRLERAKILLNDLKSNGAGRTRVIFFSDEKTFTVDPVHNRQNDRYVRFNDAEEAAEAAKYVTTTKHPASVMMLGVIASTGEVLEPIWFPKGFRLTAADYKTVLTSTVLPWMARVAGDRSYVFQQDGAPAHTAKTVQQFLEDELGRKRFWPKEFWPPQSPDLNPLDFSVWARVEAEACAVRHPNVEALKDSVNQVWAGMSSEYVRKTCASFRPRLERVIAANGGYIE